MPKALLTGLAAIAGVLQSGIAMGQISPANAVPSTCSAGALSKSAPMLFPFTADSQPGSGTSWSVPLCSGNWLVKVVLGGKAAAVTTIKAENRRLMVPGLRTKPGEVRVVSFTVNVHDRQLGPLPANAPGGTEVRLTAQQARQRNWDGELTLEFLGAPAVRSISIEPADTPTLFLLGDSMVADHAEEPSAAWGQMLPALLNSEVTVANFAEGGATLKSFLADLRFDKTLSLARAGDWFFIQFGHNDQKQAWPQTHAPAATVYASYLRAYIAEVRQRGGRPVLVTSPERRNFDARGKIVPSLGDYPETMRRIGRELDVPVLDLNQESAALYESLGAERATALFANGGKDRTHYNNAGAWAAAQLIAAAIRRQLPELAPFVAVSPAMLADHIPASFPVPR